MKPTAENIKILEKLGFTCDYDRTKNPLDEEWYSLPSGWGIRLDAIKSFKHLMKKIITCSKMTEEEDGHLYEY